MPSSVGTVLLREAMYFLQAAGVTFEPTERGMRMVPGACPEKVYEAIKAEILTPYIGTLAPILEKMRRD